MNNLKHFAWKSFEKTGGVKEYLKFKALDKFQVQIEAGEECGSCKNLRNRAEDHKVR